MVRLDNQTCLSRPVIFTERSKTVLLLWILFVSYGSCLSLLYCLILFLEALWSPAGKVLPLGALVFWAFLFIVTPKYVICSTSDLRVRLVPLNMFEPSSNFLTDRFRLVLLLWILFVICFSCLPLSYCIACSLQPCDHLLGRADLLALWYVMFSCVLSLSHMVSWVRCGTWLYRFLIFAFFLTFTYMYV